MRRFPLSLRPSPLPYTDQGAPLDPLCRALRHRASLLWHRALGAKASHPDQRFCRLCNFDLPNKQRFSLQRHKTAKSCAFCDCTPEFYGGILYWLLEKQGKLYFLQSSQTKGRGVLAAFATLVCQRNCVFLCKGTKLQNSAKPNSGDSLPVFVLECFSANETGVLISEFSAS